MELFLALYLLLLTHELRQLFLISPDVRLEGCVGVAQLVTLLNQLCVLAQDRVDIVLSDFFVVLGCAFDELQFLVHPLGLPCQLIVDLVVLLFIAVLAVLVLSF